MIIFMNKKTETQTFWNRNPCCGDWNSIDNLINWRNITEPHFKTVLNRYVKIGKALEIGCGQGIELVQNIERGIEIVGVDYSRESVIKTKKHLYEKFKGGLKSKKYNLIIADAENLPFKNSIFDYVYSLGVLHHTPDAQKGIHEANRVLKNDGIAIIMLYHKLSWKSFPISVIRTISNIMDFIFKKDKIIYNLLRKNMLINQIQGTALLELFGCPVLKMYTKKQVRFMFKKFSSVDIKCYSSNLFQLSYFLPLKGIGNFLKKIDKKIEHILGFHLIIICKK